MENSANSLSTKIIDQLFSEQKKYQFEVAQHTAAQRKAKLKALKKAIEVTFRQQIRDAMMDDFGKPSLDVDLSEIFVITSEINHAIHRLSQWMSQKPVSTPLALLGSKSYIRYEPKGVCLIISPFNFPFNITFGPLVSAVAAGNCVMVKASELVPNSARVIKQIIEHVFEPREVAFVEGDIDTSRYLTSLPFNHIFFTGSSAVGKKIMAAAAQNLCSVTLELGGKSPTIIDETAKLKTVCKRLVWGKFFNTGQVCIAPDYVFVHQTRKDEFIGEMNAAITHFFGQNPYHSADYSRVVDIKNTERLANALDEAIQKGAVVYSGGSFEINEKYIAPTLLGEVDLDSQLMQNEIFGPILPVFFYQDLEEVIRQINSQEKPLALYIYSNKQRNIDKIIKETRAGSTAINHNALQYFNNELPFGGSNNSGIGKAHGYFGFMAFSNARSVYKQILPGALELLMPPYSNLKRKLVELTVKYF